MSTRMNCPYCNFRFGALATNATNIEEIHLAPIVCENCGGVALLEGGRIRTPSAEEMAFIKDSPAWREVIDPVRRLLLDSKVPPADRSQVSLADGSPIVPGYRELLPNGMQKGYLVLSDEERAKGFVRPYRDCYTHLVCGADTSMGYRIAETYARDPSFYNGTYCCHCCTHRPLAEFVWKGTNEKVAS